MNYTAPLCFGARDDQFGKFFSTYSGKLASVKLVHLYGYVTCNKRIPQYRSYWGCGQYSPNINTVITDSNNNVLFPSSEFIVDKSSMWSSIPDYDSLSPELVLPALSNPPFVTRGQELRVWYGEDFNKNAKVDDNEGKSCCDIYARFM